MLYLTCSMIPSIEVARYGVSRAEDSFFLGGDYDAITY